uniref:Uncharacterized protein n=2 Tax=Cyprinus carpio TaxID=7962 RepID=A0A9J7YSA1_CYPCA
FRPLWVEYPNDVTTFSIEDEYLIGEVLNRIFLCTYFSDSFYNCFLQLYRLRPLNPFFLSVASQIPVFQRGGSVICRKDRVRRSSSCMENDPYALYVALNSQGSAEGELYIDDFHTFSFEKAKQFVHRHLSFAANTLSSSSVCALFFYTFSTASWIEKIVIIRGSQPSSATLKNAESAVEFEFDSTLSVLTLRKPRVNTAADWTTILR